MKQKRHTTEEIIRILREADQGKDLETVCRQHNVSAASFYRWKKKFGGMELKDARKYRQLEKENAELKLGLPQARASATPRRLASGSQTRATHPARAWAARPALDQASATTRQVHGHHPDQGAGRERRATLVLTRPSSSRGEIHHLCKEGA